MYYVPVVEYPTEPMLFHHILCRVPPSLPKKQCGTQHHDSLGRIPTINAPVLTLVRPKERRAEREIMDLLYFMACRREYCQLFAYLRLLFREHLLQ